MPIIVRIVMSTNLHLFKNSQQNIVWIKKKNKLISYYILKPFKNSKKVINPARIKKTDYEAYIICRAKY